MQHIILSIHHFDLQISQYSYFHNHFHAAFFTEDALDLIFKAYATNGFLRD